jgi:endonuclease III
MDEKRACSEDRNFTGSLAELRASLMEVSRKLRLAYGTPEHLLGNRTDPLEEAVYIVMTFQTDVPRARGVWRTFRLRFPSWERAVAAPPSLLAAALRSGGLHRQKARTIKALLRAVKKRWGSFSLRPLRGVGALAAEKELLRLPGLSLKGARCVLLYSLGWPVFPVDGNTLRVLKRLGLVRPWQKYRSKDLHERLQEAVPERERRRLHVNLVIHGQRICTPLAPKCAACHVSGMCHTARQRALST